MKYLNQAVDITIIDLIIIAVIGGVISSLIVIVIVNLFKVPIEHTGSYLLRKFSTLKSNFSYNNRVRKQDLMFADVRKIKDKITDETATNKETAAHDKYYLDRGMSKLSIHDKLKEIQKNK